MALNVTQVDVWAGEIQDQPGGVARVLRAIAIAGGSLECVIARREQARPGTGVVFVTPVKGAKVQDAARGVGLMPAENVVTLRIEGPDTAGVGAGITEALAGAGINIRGVSTAVIGRTFVTYIGLDNPADADAATKALRQVKTGRSGGRAPARSSAKRGGAVKKKGSTTKRRR